MRKAQPFNKIPTATIKSKRNKVIQAISRQTPIFYVVKIMTFRNLEEFRWFQREMGERLQVLRRINNAGIVDIIQRGIFEVQVKETAQERIVYMTRKEVIGMNLARVFEREILAVKILYMDNIKQVIWNIMALIIGGGGFGNLIISLENIIFQEVGEKAYRPVLNYFSFIGINLLKFKKSIEREEFLEIAVFLDQEALESGDLDRFQFKARNFAVIIVSLLLRRNLAHFVFRNVSLPDPVTLDNAKELYKTCIKPNLNKLLGFNTLANAFGRLKIPGLEDFIRSVLNFQNGVQDTQNWSKVRSILLENPEQPIQKNIEKISQLLWENEEEGLKQILNKKGLGLCEKGDQVYMAFKISTHLECLLQFNDWKGMMKKLQYNYKTHEMLYRLLKCTILKEEQVLEKTTLELLQVSKESYKKIGRTKKNDDKNIYTHSFQRTILDQYMDFL